jgi:hypothetical protein
MKRMYVCVCVDLAVSSATVSDVLTMHSSFHRRRAALGDDLEGAAALGCDENKFCICILYQSFVTLKVQLHSAAMKTNFVFVFCISHL